MEFIQQNLFMIAVALISGTMLLVLSVRRPGGHNALSPAKAIQLINREDALVIDVREQAEYVGGHVADARHLPLADLANRAGELDKFKAGPVLVVCQTGARSGGACRTLEKLGFAKVHSLEGGVAAWSEAGLPLKKGARK
ncbi:MAG: rhodanese-like domain-containing protein [Propionivibrio sp.]